MTAAANPAGASADHTHWCPGSCQRRVPNRFFACGDCWARLPYELQRAIQVAYRRDDAAHAEAMAAARAWYREDLKGAARGTLAETLQDMADMLTGGGRHADHDRRQVGRCAVCSCGVRVQGRLS